MAEEDDRWSLIQLQTVDDRAASFGVGTFRSKGDDGLTHRVVWSRLTSGWARMCDDMGLTVKEAREAPGVGKGPDPGAVTCFQCLGKGA